MTGDPAEPSSAPPDAAGEPSSAPPDAGDEPSLAWLEADDDPAQTLAEIWATVDLERAMLGLDAAGDPGPDDPAGAAPLPIAAGAPAALAAGRLPLGVADDLLGGRVVVVARDGRTVALAEPTTEGRLAATLARHGEGPVGRYVRAPTDLAGVRARAARRGISLSRVGSGPFGPSVLVLGERIGARLVVLVDPAAVPSRP